MRLLKVEIVLGSSHLLRKSGATNLRKCVQWCVWGMVTMRRWVHMANEFWWSTVPQKDRHGARSASNQPHYSDILCSHPWRLLRTSTARITIGCEIFVDTRNDSVHLRLPVFVRCRECSPVLGSRAGFLLFYYFLVAAASDKVVGSGTSNAILRAFMCLTRCRGMRQTWPHLHQV